jgi:hypothetical protein
MLNQSNTKPPKIIVTISAGASKIEVIADTAAERDDALSALSHMIPTIELFEDAIRQEFEKASQAVVVPEREVAVV